MKIKIISEADIQEWILLSKEYDGYVQEIASDLTEWYDGNDTSLSFDNYMKAKINKSEAFMAIDDNGCCGIIAISKTNNRITFFAISHKHDFNLVGEFILNYAIMQLNINRGITINVIKSNVAQIQKEHLLLKKFNFQLSHDDFENGVPVNSFILNPLCTE